MSINSVFGASSLYPAAAGSSNNTYQQIQQQVSAIGSALTTGNLAGAQSAFTSLQSLLPSGSSGSSASSSQSPIQSAMAALKQSLTSGSATGAQAAFTKLQQAMKGGHHHHGASESQNNASSSSDPNSISSTLSLLA